MVISDANRAIAQAMFRVALVQIRRLGDEDDAELAWLAMKSPNSSSLRALLTAGRGKPWLTSIRDALAEVGIAAADEVLEGDDNAE